MPAIFTDDEREEICVMCEDRMSEISDEVAEYIFDRTTTFPDEDMEFAEWLGQELNNMLERYFEEWSKYAAICNKATLGPCRNDRDAFEECVKYGMFLLDPNRVPRMVAPNS
jgi:hypothetical protein